MKYILLAGWFCGCVCVFAQPPSGRSSVTPIVTSNSIVTALGFVPLATGGGATNVAIHSGTGVNVSSNAAGDFTLQANTNAINTYISNYTKGTVFVATNGNNSTGIRGKSSLPFADITHAQAVMIDGDTCIVGPGIYTDTIYRTNCNFNLSATTELTGTPCLAVTNGSINIDGDGIFFGGTITLSNAFAVINCGLFAVSISQEPMVYVATNNYLNLNARLVYCDLAGTSNLTAIINADQIVQVGILNGPNVTVNIHCRRFGFPTKGGTLLQSGSYNTAGLSCNFYCEADIVDASQGGSLQITPQDDAAMKLHFIFKPTVFFFPTYEAMTILGGVNINPVWPIMRGVGQGSTNNNPIIDGYWYTSTNIVIKDEKTPYDTILSF